MVISSSPCNLDSEFAAQIAVLLTPPSPESQKVYYDEVIEKTKCHGIGIKHNKLGKGVFANKEFKEGELVLKDQILVAAQHSSNKVDCLVCSHCFCFIGSIELQIGRKLYLQSMGLSTIDDCDHETISSSSEDDEDKFLDDSHGAGPSTSRNTNGSRLSKEELESLMNGDISLPYSERFPLRPVIPCPGGCEEERYCSKLCADSDWELFHSLLCTGDGVDSSRRAALSKFVDHANRTNDIFILAGKVISRTILKYRELKGQQVQESKQQVSQCDIDVPNFSLLLESWKQFSVGFKRRWWDCIALPDDVASCDEASFRIQIRDLAFTSLELLKDAIFDKECAPLFSLEIFGHIIGMFELNNLDLVVASPVEDYFIYIDDLQVREKEVAEKLTKPFLDALDDEYSVFCQGTAFFPLQSCMNHSCCPNAKAFKRDQDKDGQAVITAVQTITPEEEPLIYFNALQSMRGNQLSVTVASRANITISYIDEDLPFEDRQALLADYGFRCTCRKCLEEQS